MKKCIALAECKSLDEVVKLINDGGSSSSEPHEIAAQYAHDAAENKENMDELGCHLEILSDAGANFASDQAEKYLRNNSYIG